MSLLSVWLASLVGSTHCVGMCGGWVAALELSRQGPAAHAVYHATRISIYVLLGCVAASVGGLLNRWGQITLWLVMGWIAWQVVMQLRGRGMPRSALGPTAALTLMKSKKFNLRSPVARAALAGAATALLPCGWLYSFVAVAAVAPTPWWGGLTLLVFGLGTVPALAFLSGAMHRLLKRIEACFPALRSQWITAGLLLLTGVWIFWQHGQHGHIHPSPSSQDRSSEHVHTH